MNEEKSKSYLSQISINTNNNINPTIDLNESNSNLYSGEKKDIFKLNVNLNSKNEKNLSDKALITNESIVYNDLQNNVLDVELKNKNNYKKKKTNKDSIKKLLNNFKNKLK